MWSLWSTALVSQVAALNWSRLQCGINGFEYIGIVYLFTQRPKVNSCLRQKQHFDILTFFIVICYVLCFL